MKNLIKRSKKYFTNKIVTHQNRQTRENFFLYILSNFMAFEFSHSRVNSVQCQLGSEESLFCINLK